MIYGTFPIPSSLLASLSYILQQQGMLLPSIPTLTARRRQIDLIPIKLRNIAGLNLLPRRRREKPDGEGESDVGVGRQAIDHL